MLFKIADLALDILDGCVESGAKLFLGIGGLDVQLLLCGVDLLDELALVSARLAAFDARLGGSLALLNHVAEL